MKRKRKVQQMKENMGRSPQGERGLKLRRARALALMVVAPRKGSVG